MTNASNPIAPVFEPGAKDFLQRLDLAPAL